ncbi:hypothetical protein Celal_2386 [Cellulophaga algicola DSM 14237]|uniref:Ig-like domain-containing protein n=1 Tax=Cellulophaga algicola (strain DSM 14237 / IC166 / ACAM 630) TaxID=688270 RepID=E6X851_CELAD|nr:hypothetical protein [Cellulophaga algicola]ADV49677.1 hypothetical protein Celal_2386 [Cellulophaga algicola DSM 14237]
MSVTPTTECLDSDNDGVPDVFDLDSDNDGIYDAVEAGHNQAHTDGVVTGAVGTDGVPDNVQNDPNRETVNYTLSDSDLDTIPDVLEFDSDNDGCNDSDEAYGAKDTDSDANGFYGSGQPNVDVNGRITAATYPEPNDGDSNTVYDYKEKKQAPIIADKNNTTIQACYSTDVTLINSALYADTFQWQLLNGSNWIDISDSTKYSGTGTNTLDIINVTLTENGNQYRLIASHSSTICDEDSSGVTTLNVNDEMDAPVSGGDQSYCSGDSIPQLSANVPSDETVDWYANLSGGTALLESSLSYTPAGAGTYYAEARSTTFVGCTSTTRTPITLTEESPSVVTIGADQVVFVGDNAIFTATASNSDTFHWEVSTDGGITFNSVAESSEYTGTQTVTLTVVSARALQNGYRFRFVASTAGSSCGTTNSSSAVLTVKVKTVITNRRITYRVKKN